MECHRVQVDVLTASHANRSLHFRLMYELACFVSHFRFLIMGGENDSAAYLPDSQIHRHPRRSSGVQMPRVIRTLGINKFR